MKKLYLQLCLGVVVSALGAHQLKADKVLYADDFNRSSNKNLGKTSVGSYTWDDKSWHSFSIVSSNMYVVNHEVNAHAHVKYDLNSQEAYDVTLDITMIDSTESGSFAGLFLLPRTSQSTNVVGNSGWVVNCNYYYPNGSGAWTRFYWYDGSDTNEWGSIPVTRLDTNQFDRGDVQNITIKVRGDYASLFVSQADGATLVDKNRYIGNYNTGNESVFLFARRGSIGLDRSATSKPWSKHYVDNFVVESVSCGTVINIK